MYEESYILDVLKEYGHESLHFIRDDTAGLKSIVAIHNTVLGKGTAVGGTRIWNYKNEGEALLDVLRLSEGMTYKSSMAKLALGGGKAVIMADSKTQKTEKLLKTYGSFLTLINSSAQQRANGITQKFITAEDVGTSVNDISIINQTAPGYLVGQRGKSGDPSVFTAQGVIAGIESAIHHVFGTRDMKGLSVHVQGLGNVGQRVVEYLSKRGAKVSVYDIDKDKTKCLSKQLGVTIKSPTQILTGRCDVFSPCALGAVVNSKNVNRFGCRIIAGAANNQLESLQYGNILKDRGILYAPDYVINAGGIISASREVFGMEGKEGEEWATQKVKGIYDTLSEIFEKAERENVGTQEAADQLAKQFIENTELEK